MIVLVLVVLYAALCYKWGAWKRWREFYPTIQYMIIANLAYNYVFYEYPLWLFDGFMGDTVLCIIMKFLIYPSAVILFLTHYPVGFWKQVVYILGWAAINTAFEYVAFLTGGIHYYHGWGLLASFVLLIIAFALVRLHYKRPLFVWLPSLASSAAVIIIFGLPYPR